MISNQRDYRGHWCDNCMCKTCSVVDVNIAHSACYTTNRSANLVTSTLLGRIYMRCWCIWKLAASSLLIHTDILVKIGLVGCKNNVAAREVANGERVCKRERRCITSALFVVFSIWPVLLIEGFFEIDFSLHLNLVHWPSKELQAPWQCSLSLQGHLL